MRFRNLSRKSIPKDLWRHLALAMGLGSTLPQAVRDEIGMYRGCKTLRITIRRERQFERGKIVTVGSYAYGHIILSPCPDCTLGFLTEVYLHELFHAWIDQFHEELYTPRSNMCANADAFANVGFFVLGGTILRKPPLCGRYRLPLKTAVSKIPDFKAFTRTLIGLSTGKVRNWMPVGWAEAGRLGKRRGTLAIRQPVAR